MLLDQIGLSEFFPDLMQMEATFLLFLSRSELRFAAPRQVAFSPALMIGRDQPRSRSGVFEKLFEAGANERHSASWSGP